MTDRTSDYCDLESPIGDLSLMVSVTCTMMEVFSKDMQSSRSLTGASVENVVKSIEREFEELMFCIYQVNSMAKALERRYFAESEVAA